MSETEKRGSSAVASRHISRRCSAVATVGGRCGGAPVGTNTTSSRRAQSIAASAAAMWPLCIGSKVPPTTPSLMRARSWLVLEFRLADAHGVARLRTRGLEGRVHAEAVERDLEVVEA